MTLVQFLQRGCLAALGLACRHVQAASPEVAANPQMSPPLAGGVIAVWLQSPAFDREAILRMPVVKGGQIWRTAAFDLPAGAIRPASDGAQIVIQNADLPVCLHLVAIERE